MSNIIEDFYYGNIEPQEVNTELTAKLKKKLNKLAEKEEQLTARLNGEEKELFLNYASAYNEFSSISNSDSFISGFRLGAKFIYDTFLRIRKDNAIMKNNTNIQYRQVGDFNIPNLILPPEEADITLGKWGMMHKDYLRKHKPVVFYTLFTQGKLWQYLADIDNQAHQMVDFLVEQMKATEDITEQLKTENQIEWIQRMNDIEDWAKTFVLSGLIYI